MPKNTKGGNKHKKQKNSSIDEKNREYPLPDDNSHVAIITERLGDGRYRCQIVDENGIDKQIYIANLSKGVKRRYCRGILLEKNSYVLMALRDFQTDKTKTDIIFAYKDIEVKQLISENIISVNTIIANDDIVEFTDSNIEEVNFSEL